MGDMSTSPREPVRGLTFEDVWALFQETDRKFQETDRKFQENERLMHERSAEIERLMHERSAETDRRMDERFAKTERLIQTLTEKTDRQLGELGNRFGELAEHLVTPNITEKFRALNYTFTKAAADVKFTDPQGKTLTEVDVWLENGEFALAVEVKSYLRIQDVKDHIKRMEILRKYADERRDTRKLLGAVAGAIVKTPVRNYALEKGFYVIQQSGDTVKIEAPEGFTPRIW
ncbi:hypothetical protein LQZ21_09100 [Treponema sp. TIM-1]|uniref:hypothetical protein n=1 Tax=Treponema sp. TIM-1 TaxID=2898417 RepID=UPI0039800A3F